MGLSMKEKIAVAVETAKRYCKAKKKTKETILDEFVALTHYNRKYAIRKLNKMIFHHNYQFNNNERKSVKVVVAKKKKRVYIKKYGEEVVKSLIKIWAFFDCKCGVNLVTFLRENLDSLVESSRFEITESVKEKLKTISSSTVDRIIKRERGKFTPHGISTTRPNKNFNLNKMIPIRTHFDWDERKPGFFEMDTVSHDGGNASGEYIFTLTMTDVYTGWTEIRPILNKAHRWVKENIENIKNTLGYKMKGVDSDNGGEFKNYPLYNWCVENDLVFTRSRSYKKNDNCFVEQKNYDVVRKLVGYYRFEGEETLSAMKELYEKYCLLRNYFYPSVRIIAKERVGARTLKKYDAPKTPLLRCLEASDNEISQAEKERLLEKKRSLDIVQLKLEVNELQERVLSLAKHL